MPVSIKEIAKKTGYSAQTVSRVLNNNGAGHRQDTCDRILKVAEEMGYRPNSLAQAMVRGKFDAVGLLQSTNSGRSYLPMSLLASIHDELAARNLHLSIGRLPDEKLTDSSYMPKMLREWSCDGFIINYTDHAPQGMAAVIERSRLPSIWINSKRANDCVYPDDAGGGKLAVEYLVSQGHTRIAYMHLFSGYRLNEAHYSVRDRLNGYKAGMRKAGLEPDVHVLEIKSREETRIDYCKEILRKKKNRPSAILTYSHAETILIAGLELGIRQEEMPMILSFADHPLNLAGRPQIHVHLDQYELGRMAVERLLEKFKNPRKELKPLKVPYRIKLRTEQIYPPVKSPADPGK